MSIALLFQNQAPPNLFRNAVLAACDIPAATEILICSGFFQNNFKGSAYMASREGSLASKLKASSARVVTVGVHNVSWLPAFDRFNADLVAAGVQVAPRRATHHHWHAKVFIVSTARGPVFAAIGSSNFTRNAFSTSLPFNYEADVLLWVPQARGVAARVATVLQEAAAIDVIKAPYNARRNGQLTVRQRAQDIRERIFAVTSES